MALEDCWAFCTQENQKCNAITYRKTSQICYLFTESIPNYGYDPDSVSAIRRTKSINE